MQPTTTCHVRGMQLANGSHVGGIDMVDKFGHYLDIYPTILEVQILCSLARGSFTLELRMFSQ